MTDPAPLDHDHTDAVARLASDLVRIDSRSFVSNIAVADRIEAELAGFEIERLDYRDPAGVAKRALVAHRGPAGGIGLSGHMDTVPETGWTDDPWSGRLADGLLYGLGSTDMKGAVAATIVAARALPEGVPVTLLFTADEETTKAGAQLIGERSDLARRAAPRAIVVAEPTDLDVVRGHRAHVVFTVTATGLQAHSSTGRGRNANWDLVPFLAEMRALHERLRTDPAFLDPAYDPPFSDFNVVIDNFGTAVNVTVPKAVATIKFRYSRSVPPEPVAEMVREAARRCGLAVEESRDGAPPELPEDDPFVRLCAGLSGTRIRTAPYGTDAAELGPIAPCVILGPGDIGQAHRPGECVPVAELAKAAALFRRLALAAVE